jgi:hypothetical protein
MNHTTGIIGGVVRRSKRRGRGSQVLRRAFAKTVTYTHVRRGRVSTVSVTTNLSGLLFFHWYVDGTWVGMTGTNQHSFVTLPGEQVSIECIPTQDPDFDFLASAPAVTSRRETLWWIRSADSDVAAYKVEQQKDAGSWLTIATVDSVVNQWEYQLTTPQLDDLGDYVWRVSAVDAAGTVGPSAVLNTKTIVRTPDAPEFTATFDSGTLRVAFAEVA